MKRAIDQQTQDIQNSINSRSQFETEYKNTHKNHNDNNESNEFDEEITNDHENIKEREIKLEKLEKKDQNQSSRSSKQKPKEKTIDMPATPRTVARMMAFRTMAHSERLKVTPMGSLHTGKFTRAREMRVRAITSLK